MCGLLVAVRDPFLDDNDIDAFSVRMGFEQMPAQTPPFRDLARTRALLVDAANEASQDVITPSFWKHHLGCSLDDFVAIAILLHTGACHNGGVFRMSWLAQQNLKAIDELIPRDVIKSVVENHFVMTRDRFRAIAESHAQADWRLRRYEFNPLCLGPFVELPGRDPIAPVLYQIFARATPGSLYYTAPTEIHGEFTRALGAVFEHYVGKQLALCSPELLISEVLYDEGGSRSVDFILVMSSLVVLVEAKATPLSEGARLGTSRLKSDFERAPGKAVRQIERTANLIRSGHSAFEQVPKDRRVVGLVVTMEPYHLCASALVFPNGGHTVPTWLCSMRDLEHLMEIEEPSCEELLRDIDSGSQNSWSLTARLNKIPAGHNRILDDAWKALPFNRLTSG